MEGVGEEEEDVVMDSGGEETRVDENGPSVKRTHKESHRGLIDRQISNAFKRLITKYRANSRPKSMRRMAAVVFLDSSGRPRCIGHKLLRGAFQESNLKNMIIRSEGWRQEEILENSKLDESTAVALPEPAEGLEKMNAQSLQLFLQQVLSVLDGSKRHNYRTATKPEYWPPNIDHANPKSRRNFINTSYQAFPTLGDVLRYVIRFIYVKNDCYHLINDGLAPSLDAGVPNSGNVTVAETDIGGLCRRCRQQCANDFTPDVDQNLMIQSLPVPVNSPGIPGAVPATIHSNESSTLSFQSRSSSANLRNYQQRCESREFSSPLRSPRVFSEVQQVQGGHAELPQTVQTVLPANFDMGLDIGHTATSGLPATSLCAISSCFQCWSASESTRSRRADVEQADRIRGDCRGNKSRRRNHGRHYHGLYQPHEIMGTKY